MVVMAISLRAWGGRHAPAGWADSTAMSLWAQASIRSGLLGWRCEAVAAASSRQIRSRARSRWTAGVRPLPRPPERSSQWTGDALHGPTAAGRKTYLFAFVDDHSRALVGYRWGLGEDTLRLEAALRAGLASRGVPKLLYVDNGSAFVSKQLERACAILGIRLVHSRPGEPAGRGKIERAFGTVRRQFLVELAARGGARDLDELNRLFAAWVEGIYHRRVHSQDRAAANGAVPRRRGPAQAAHPGRAARGVPVGGAPPGVQDRDGRPARQPLRGRPRPGRRDRRAGLRPVRPGHDRGPLPEPAHGGGPAGQGRPPRPSPGQTRGHTRLGPGAADRDRLPRHGRGQARRPDPPHDRLRRTAPARPRARPRRPC